MMESDGLKVLGGELSALGILVQGKVARHYIAINNHHAAPTKLLAASHDRMTCWALSLLRNSK